MDEKTRYARAGDVNIAYKVIGDGPIDIVVSFGFISHVEHVLTEPRVRAWYDRVASFSRVILIDRRGVGLSDSVDRAPTLEQQVDDVRAVMDDVGSETAVMYGFTVGAPFALMFAAMEPQRVSHLVLSSGFARMTRADGYPHGNPPEVRAALRQLMIDRWGSGDQSAASIPSLVGDPEFREWVATLERQSTAPSGAARFFDLVGDIDVRSLLPTVSQPTLVLHPSASVMIEVGHSEYLAEHIPNARFFDIPGADIVPVTAEARETVIGEIEEFLTGTRTQPKSDRVLSTILFTDIVDSTRRAAELGDRGWRELLDQHDAIVRTELERFRGREVNTTGDGFLAAFDGPERAIRCALSVSRNVEQSGLAVRAGVHTGECEVRGEDLGGITVHIGARVAADAAPNEVLVSQTVRELAVGSDLTFEDRGEHTLKGIPTPWRLYAATDRANGHPNGQ